MSITQARKQREFEAREELFLETAQKLIAEEGLLPLQMARLAEACEYSTGTLYQHFTSREDLLVALATRRAVEYAGLFLHAAQWKAQSRDRMMALAIIDHMFCNTHPDHTRLIQYVFAEVVWNNASPARRQAMTECCRSCTKAVQNIVSDAIACGDLQKGNLTPAEISLGPWAICQGVQSLLRTQGLLESAQIHRAGELLFHHVQIHLNGLGWKPVVNPDDASVTPTLMRKVQKEIMQDEA